MLSGGAFSSGVAKEEDLPDLKPMVPKMHKVEPYKAGIEHNQYIKKKAKKKKRKKKKSRKNL